MPRHEATTTNDGHPKTKAMALMGMGAVVVFAAAVGAPFGMTYWAWRHEDEILNELDGVRVDYADAGQPPGWLPTAARAAVARYYLRAGVVNANGCGNVDDGLALIAKLRHARMLYLAKSSVTDAGLAHVASMRELTTVTLWDTDVTDDGVRLLSSLGFLAYLDLTGTHVTDACLETIEEMPRLEVVDLQRTSVTAEGVADLRRRRPGLRVVR